MWVLRGRVGGDVTTSVNQASCGGVGALSCFTEAVTVSCVLSRSSDAYAELPKATFNFVMTVHPSASNNSAPTGPIFTKFYIWVFSWKTCPQNSSCIWTSQE